MVGVQAFFYLYGFLLLFIYWIIYQFLIPLLISVEGFPFRGRPVSLLGFASGVSSVSLFPQESSPSTPINSWKQFNKDSMFENKINLFLQNDKKQSRVNL
ncbi:hypothetical protein A6P54_20200 [Bacillus sp. MKU004]|nr:hypothetical protein A6P54_20200 [Bacillus sp. MKU004]